MRMPGRFLSALLVPLVLSCSTRWQAAFVTPAKIEKLDVYSPFVKCHLRNGEVYVLTSWLLDAQKRVITGEGAHYDASRNLIAKGNYELSLDQIALVETNRPETVVHGNVVVLAVLTAVSIPLSVLCLTSPKSCFGSCPTFYVHDGEKPALQAEGFSDAVAPSLEKTDVDALYVARPEGRQIGVVMTNEAYETHAVNSVRLLAVPRPADGRVLRAAERYYAARTFHPPTACTAETGSCLAAVSSVDETEYASLADEKDLATRETVELVFPAGKGRRGLVIGARNTLLNTFVFYQGLAYTGTSAGDWLMQLERGGPVAKSVFARMLRHLGDVDAQVLTRRGWVPVGAFAEVGPIAREVQMLPLPEELPEGEVRVRLVLTKGNWRLDYLALAELTGEVRPITLAPVRVEREGVEDPQALARLENPAEYVVTYPGDDYTLRFDLPEGEHELFLESRGYYYEWMRKEWLPEEDPEKALEMLFRPEVALKRLAPAYKKLEPEMERIFWQSRFGR